MLISIETPFINIDFTSEERKNTEISIYVTAGVKIIYCLIFSKKLYFIFGTISFFGYRRLKSK